MMLLTPHVAARMVPPEDKASVNGDYLYYHYGCDGIDDIGWGCGYRTLQTMCSWTLGRLELDNLQVPSIREIQNTLVDIGDRSPSFVGSRDWIGTVEASYVLDTLFTLPCKIHYFEAGEFEEMAEEVFWQHFMKHGAPVMLGGDRDNASKCILAVRRIQGSSAELLILDPHFDCEGGVRKDYHAPTANELVSSGFLAWRSVNSFSALSFYNACLPQAPLALSPSPDARRGYASRFSSVETDGELRSDTDTGGRSLASTSLSFFSD